MKRRYWILIILLAVSLFGIVWAGFIHQHRGRESLFPISDKVNESTENINRIGRELKPVSPQEEKRIGRKLHRRLSNQQHLLPDQHPLTGYVQNIGANLLTEVHDRKPFDYQFFVVDSARINAFALPGGYIYVTKNMLQEVIQSEAELAGLIAHEIAHVELNHCSDSVRYHEDRMDGKMSPVQLVHQLMRFSYSERLERSADQYGVKLAVRNGYHPLGMSNLFSRMLDVRYDGAGSDEDEGHQRVTRMIADAIRSYLRTHPKLPERIESLTDWIHGHSEWVGQPFYTGEKNVRRHRSMFQAQFDDERKRLEER